MFNTCPTYAKPFAQADGFLFWRFVQLSDPGKSSLNAAYFLQQFQGQPSARDELTGHLLRAQTNLVQDLFFERLRGGKSIDFVKSFLPAKLQSKAFLSKDLWLLALFPDMFISTIRVVEMASGSSALSFPILSH